MAWKTEIPYQNANSTLWTEPHWFCLSVPRWLHFPTKLVSAPLPRRSFCPHRLHLHSHFLMFFWKQRSVFHQQGQGPIGCHSRVRDKSQATLCPLACCQSSVSCALAQCGRLYFGHWRSFKLGGCCWNVTENTFWLNLQKRVSRCLLLH